MRGLAARWCATCRRIRRPRHRDDNFSAPFRYITRLAHRFPGHTERDLSSRSDISSKKGSAGALRLLPNNFVTFIAHGCGARKQQQNKRSPTIRYVSKNVYYKAPVKREKKEKKSTAPVKRNSAP